MDNLINNIDHLKSKSEFFDFKNEYSRMRSYSWSNHYFFHKVETVALRELDNYDKLIKFVNSVIKKEDKYFLNDDMKKQLQLLKDEQNLIIASKTIIKMNLKSTYQLLNTGYNDDNFATFKDDVFFKLDQIIPEFIKFNDSLFENYELAKSINSKFELFQKKTFLEYIFNKDVKDKQEVVQPTNKNRIKPK